MNLIIIIAILTGKRSFTKIVLMDIKDATRKIRKFFYTQRRLPTYSEISLLFGFHSKKASFELAKKLIQAGVLEKDSKGKLIPRDLMPDLPLLGSIKAGTPASTEEQLLDTMSLENYLVNDPEKSYLLKVSGDSMIEAGINHGDLVVIEKDKEPKEGDVIVAYIDNEFTLKYFQRKDGKVYLMPANRNYSPIYPKENLTIFGTVVSVIRKYH